MKVLRARLARCGAVVKGSILSRATIAIVAIAIVVWVRGGFQ